MAVRDDVRKLLKQYPNAKDADIRKALSAAFGKRDYQRDIDEARGTAPKPTTYTDAAGTHFRPAGKTSTPKALTPARELFLQRLGTKYAGKADKIDWGAFSREEAAYLKSQIKGNEESMVSEPSAFSLAAGALIPAPGAGAAGGMVERALLGKALPAAAKSAAIIGTRAAAGAAEGIAANAVISATDPAHRAKNLNDWLAMQKAGAVPAALLGGVGGAVLGRSHQGSVEPRPEPKPAHEVPVSERTRIADRAALIKAESVDPAVTLKADELRATTQRRYLDDLYRRSAESTDPRMHQKIDAEIARVQAALDMPAGVPKNAGVPYAERPALPEPKPAQKALSAPKTVAPPPVGTPLSTIEQREIFRQLADQAGAELSQDMSTATMYFPGKRANPVAGDEYFVGDRRVRVEKTGGTKRPYVAYSDIETGKPGKLSAHKWDGRKPEARTLTMTDWADQMGYNAREEVIPHGEVQGQEEAIVPVPTEPRQPLQAPVSDVVAFPVQSLRADPERFQYKLGMGESGAGAELRGVKKWNKALSGVVLAWRDPTDGQAYVVNGHHRLELAKRLDVPDLDTRFIDARNAEEARSMGAITNIAEGRGTAIDAAKFLRDSDMTAEHLADEGVSVKGAVAEQGAALAHLDQKLFNQVVQGDMSVSRGVAIGRSLPDPAEQLALYELTRRRAKGGKRLTDAEVEELVRFVKSSGDVEVPNPTLFGEESLKRNLAVEKAQLSAYLKDRLGKDKKLFGFVSKGTRPGELARGGNVIDAEQSARIAQEAAAAREVYDRLSGYSGPISDTLNRAAERLAKGENVNAVREQLYTEVRQAVQETIPGGPEPLIEAGAPVARPRDITDAPGSGTPQVEPELTPSTLEPQTPGRFTTPYRATPSALNARMRPEVSQRVVEGGLFPEQQLDLSETGAGEPPMGPTAPDAPEFGSGNTLFTKERFSAAMDRAKRHGAQLNAIIMPDPAMIRDLVEIGGFYAEGGLREFGAWSTKMVADFGETVKPYLAHVWSQVNPEAPVVTETPAAQPSAQLPSGPEPPRTKAPAASPSMPPSSGKPTYAANINLTKLDFGGATDSAGIVDMIRTSADEWSGEITNQRRGVRTWDDTTAAATLKAQGLDTDALKRMYPGRAVNAETAEAVSGVFMNLADRVKQAQRRYAETHSLDDLNDVMIASEEYKIGYLAAVGNRAEAGRTLNIYKKIKQAMASENATYKERAHQMLIELYGGADMAGDVLGRLAEIPEGDFTSLFGLLNRVSSAKMTFGEKLDSYRIANMLTSTRAHARNMVGNAIHAALNEAIHPITVAADAIMAPLQKRERLFYLRQVGPSAAAALDGVSTGLSNAKYALQHGFSQIEAQRMDMPHGRELPPIKIKGKEITNPLNYAGRFLSAEDAIARSVVESASLSKQAMAKAINEAHAASAEGSIPEGESAFITRRYRELRESPTPGMLEESYKDGDYILFTSELGEGAKTLAKAINWEPLKGLSDQPVIGHLAKLKPVKWIVPFYTVPINILKRSAEWTPAGLAKLTDATTRSGREGPRTVARAVAGTAIMAAAAQLHQAGLLAGNPPDNPSERDAWYADGRKPWTIRIGGRWVPLDLLGPLATPVAAVAGAMDVYDRTGDAPDSSVVANALSTAMKAFQDRSFLSGFNALSQAIDEPDRAADRFVTSTLQPLVPASGLLGVMSEATDPYMRDTRRYSDSTALQPIAEGIQSRIPGLRNQLPARLDTMGQPVPTAPTGPAAMLGLVGSPVRKDAVRQELASLGIAPDFVDKSVQIDSKRIPLARDQWREYQQSVGQATYAAIQQVIESDFYKAAPAEERAQILDEVIRDSRQQAREEFKAGIQGGMQ